jgi:lysozyme
MIDMSAMEAELMRDEGSVPYAYQDSLGYWTIGVGHCIDSRMGCKLPDEFIKSLLCSDIDSTIADLNEKLPWWTQLDEIRQRVLVNMCFNLGINKLMRFQKFLESMKNSDWKSAAEQMQNSVWWGQVGARAVRLQHMVLTGEVV